MTITELINKLQQLKTQNGDVKIVDESEGAFNYYKVMYNTAYPNQNTNMSAGRPGEVIL